jgi:hypothetical protein
MAAEGILLQFDASPFRWLGPGGAELELARGHRRCHERSRRRAVSGAGGLRGVSVADARGRHRPWNSRRDLPRSPLDFESSKRLRSVLEEDFTGQRLPTQFGRLLVELGIESIPRAFAAGERAGGAAVAHPAGPAGHRARPSRRAEPGRSQRLPRGVPRTLSRPFTVAPGVRNPPLCRSTRRPISIRLFCFKYKRKVASDNTICFAGQVI